MIGYMKRILVTGASGFISSYLIEQLKKLDYEVFLTDIRSGQFKLDCKCDINSLALDKFISRIVPNTIIHLAAQTHVVTSFENPTLDLESNVKGTVNIIKSALKVGCKNFIYLNSAGAIYDYSKDFPATEETAVKPISPYGISKLMAENYLQVLAENRNLSWTSLALSNVYGSIKRNPKGVIFNFYQDLKLKRDSNLWGEDSSRDFVYIDDVVKAILLAIESPQNCRINISSATETKVSLVFDLLSEILGIEGHLILNEMRSGEILRSSVSNNKANQLLNWRPEIDFRHGLELSVLENQV
jgi:UDP-glucose 4-epimerase